MTLRLLQLTARGLVWEGNDQLADQNTEPLPDLVDFDMIGVEETLDSADAEMTCAPAATSLDLTDVDEGGVGRATIGELPSAGDLLG